MEIAACGHSPFPRAVVINLGVRNERPSHASTAPLLTSSCAYQFVEEMIIGLVVLGKPLNLKVIGRGKCDPADTEGLL